MSAFACEPDRGSEPGNGWNTAVQAARFHQVWVLTRSEERPFIERHLQNHPQKNLHFIYAGIPHWLIPWQRGDRRLRPYYVMWQAFILPIVFRAHRRHAFDVIHHVTFNTIDVPGFLWLLRVPFIWGPVGGGQIPPEAFKEYYGNRWRKEQIRKIRKKSLRFDPIVRMAIKRAAHILAANADTEHMLRKLGAKRVSRMLDVGVNLSPFEDGGVQQDGVFSIIWAGRLEHRKAPLMALAVLRRLLDQGVDAQLWMVGDGPLHAEVQEAAMTCGVQQNFHLMGAVPHPTMRELYGNGDVFLFTSLQDTSGTVVLEAMAAWLPVVALNHQGAAEMVTDETGILIDIESQKQVIGDLAAALAALARNPDRRRAMGQNARARMEAVYSWDRKGELLRSFYADVLRNAR